VLAGLPLALSLLLLPLLCCFSSARPLANRLSPSTATGLTGASRRRPAHTRSSLYILFSPPPVTSRVTCKEEAAGCPLRGTEVSPLTLFTSRRRHTGSSLFQRSYFSSASTTLLTTSPGRHTRFSSIIAQQRPLAPTCLYHERLNARLDSFPATHRPL
jgi:hypothetical protein